MYKSFCNDGLIVLQEINCTFSNSWKMSSVLPLYWMTHPKCQVKAWFRTLFRCVSKVIMELITCILKILSKYFHVCVLFRYWRCFCIFGVFMVFFFCLFIFLKHMSSWIFWHRQNHAISLTVSWIFQQNPCISVIV